MSEINTVNEQLMLLAKVIAKRDEISAILMERGDSVDVEPKSKNVRRTIGGEDSNIDCKIVATTPNELISAVAYQDNYKVRSTHKLILNGNLGMY